MDINLAGNYISFCSYALLGFCIKKRMILPQLNFGMKG